MSDAGKHHGGGAWVSASEVACFAYCPEQWRLEHGLNLDASNAAERQAGTRHHARKADQERLAGSMLRLAKLLATLLLAGVAYLLFLARTGR